MNTLLTRLEKVKQTAPDRWRACCPAHHDKSPSLGVRVLSDRRILVNCLAGCDVYAVLAAVGLDICDLFPERLVEHGRPERHPFPAADVLRALAFDSLVVLCAAKTVASGQALSDADHDSLLRAVAHFEAGLMAAGVGHHG